MRGHVHRRDFITLLGGVAAAWPITARAQQAAKPVIGFSNTSADTSANYVAAFRQVLNEVGYVEGRLAIEYRWSEVGTSASPTLAAELVRRPVAVFVAANNTGAGCCQGGDRNDPDRFCVLDRVDEVIE